MTSDLGNPTFKLLAERQLTALNLHAAEYEHLETGARHWHFKTDNSENIFLVALRTVPQDNTGVAHILEHTVLCGSEKYPVRDPFFMMLRRSLNTFMNAFTSSDWTAYPFASKNRKDFDNLLKVYLDAVFFPTINPLDFAQEGHRLEFSDPNDASTPLEYKGVVYNEMKGAMSSINSILYDSLNRYLFPNNTYHFNSGGDPEAIPDLSYEQLKSFYETHYHPSNAVFMTFGDIPATEHQAVFEKEVLQRFSNTDKKIAVNAEKRLFAPITVTEAFGVANEDELTKNTHHVMGWLWGKTTDLYQKLEAELLSSALLDNSASPLRQALEKSEIGTAPSALCGLEDSNLELSFMCGLEGGNPEDSDAFKQLVLSVLEKVANEGIDQKELESVLHQLEFSQREISGDGFPYGLQIMLSALTPSMHRADVFGFLEIDSVLNQLRENIKDPDYIKQLTRKLLLENQHRVQLTMVPDLELNERKLNGEKQQLAAIKSELSEAEAKQIITQSSALEARQNEANDPSILPKVTRADVPTTYEAPSPDEKLEQKGRRITHYNQGTNGISYQMLVTPIPELSADQLQLLPRYVDCITELGVGDQSYLAMQRKQSEITGGINSYSSIRSTVDDINQVSGYLVLSGKALNKNVEAMTELLYQTHHQLQFNEADRIAELIAQDLSHQEQSITGSGHSFAMSSASADLSKMAALRYQMHGLKGFQNLKQLNHSLSKDQERVAKLTQELTQLHQVLLSAPTQLVTISEADQWQEIANSLNKHWQNTPTHQTNSSIGSSINLNALPERRAWLHNTQVNFCAKAYPTVSESHPDAPVLQVLAVYLRNSYLHSAIREKGGAYGGGAAHDGQIGAFRFYSYRDPRLSETLTDFDSSIQQFLDDGAQEEKLEEAVLGVVSDIDAPGSPAGEARSSFFHDQFGRDIEFRKTYRSRVLTATTADLERVANTYLQPDKAKVAVITSPAMKDQLQGFEIKQL